MVWRPEALSKTGVSGVVPWQLVLRTCVASDRSDQEVTGVTLEVNRLLRDIPPALPMAGEQDIDTGGSPWEGTTNSMVGNTTNGCGSICKVYVCLLVVTPLPLESHNLYPDVNVLYCGFLSQRACGEFQHSKCVSVKLYDVDPKVEVMQTFLLQDES